MKKVLALILAILMLGTLVSCGNAQSSTSDQDIYLIDSKGNFSKTPQWLIDNVNWYLDKFHKEGKHTDAPNLPDYVKGEDVQADDGNIILTFQEDDNGNISAYDMSVKSGGSAEQYIYLLYLDCICYITEENGSALVNEYDDWYTGGKQYKYSLDNGFITHDIIIGNVTMTAHSLGLVDTLELNACYTDSASASSSEASSQSASNTSQTQATPSVKTFGICNQDFIDGMSKKFLNNGVWENPKTQTGKKDDGTEFKQYSYFFNNYHMDLECFETTNSELYSIMLTGTTSDLSDKEQRSLGALIYILVNYFEPDNSLDICNKLGVDIKADSYDFSDGKLASENGKVASFLYSIDNGSATLFVTPVKK